MCQVAPESPSNIKMKGRVWVLNLDMIESNSGYIINKVFEDSGDLNSVAAFDEGNVLFSKLRPYLNKVTIPDGKGYATTELVPLRPNTEELRQYFLSFLLRTDEFVKYADGIATGTKMPRMPMTALREFKCILPPTEQQDKFCGISKRADKSKFAGFKSQFIEGYYNRYEPTNLGDHISVIRGVSYKPDDIRETGDEAVAILRSNNISDGEINFEDLVYVSPTCVSEKQFVDAGDIVMCGSNGSKKLVGKAGLIAEKQSRTSFGAFCLGIRCKKTLAPEYLNAFFNSQMYRDIIEELGNGTNIINIRPDHITSLSIPIPEKNVQNEFVELTRQADKSKYLN